MEAYIRPCDRLGPAEQFATGNPQMSWFQGPLGKILLAIVLAGVLAGAGGYALVWRVTHPPRSSAEPIDFDSLLISVENVTFPSTDGLALKGWFLRGDSSAQPIVLAHDWGGDKSDLVHLALALHRTGHSILLFDFRGHGESATAPSTLGVHEKRDVAGAIDFLAEQSAARGPVGVYGVGMGAHAALRAVEDRPALRVMVLDSLYTDAAQALSNRLFAAGGLNHRWLNLIPQKVFDWSYLRGAETDSSWILSEILGRDYLLLASDDDAEMCRELQKVVASIPAQPDVDGSLEILPASQAVGLFGEDLSRYHDRVARFFESRL